jgi:hypothetical protein
LNKVKPSPFGGGFFAWWREESRYRKRTFCYLILKPDEKTRILHTPMEDHPFSISDLSSHLFGDTDRNALDFEKSKEQIIYQVLGYGLMQDWTIIQQVYSKATIQEVVVNLRQLDPVTLSFIANCLGIDRILFRCYKNGQ